MNIKNNVEYLAYIQQQTNTKPIVIDEQYKELFMSFHMPDYDETDSKKVSASFDETIKKYRLVELPTPYESMVHYPLLLDLTKELYSIGTQIDFFAYYNPDFQMPLIGTANLAQLDAFAQSDFNTIIIDRGLLNFFANMGRILVDLISTEVKSDWVIRPSVLTVKEIQKRILSNQSILKDFTEIMTSYTKYGTVIPFSHHMKLHSSTKSQFDNMIGMGVWRFIIAHEMMHLLLNHKESTPETEREADIMATQLCAKCVEKLQPETQFYWIPVFVTGTLDILTECNKKMDIYEYTHPEDRVEYTHETLKKIKAGDYAIALSEAIQLIVILLWVVTKSTIIDLAKDTSIKDLEELRQVIASTEFSW